MNTIPTAPSSEESRTTRCANTIILLLIFHFAMIDVHVLSWMCSYGTYRDVWLSRVGLWCSHAIIVFVCAVVYKCDVAKVVGRYRMIAFICIELAIAAVTLIRLS